MAREYNLKPGSSSGEDVSAGSSATINRRQFLRYGFNTATGVLAASLRVLGFAAILLPPGGSNEGELAVKFWAKGREDEAWYGAKHEQVMTRQDFVDEAAKIKHRNLRCCRNLERSPCSRDLCKSQPIRKHTCIQRQGPFQYTEGVDETGKTIGHFEDLSDLDPRLISIRQSGHDFRTLHTFVLHSWMAVGFQLIH